MTEGLFRLGPFETAPVLAVAVSGGADSMALALLAHEWAQARSGRIIALTVDHRLRKESAAEAWQAGKWLTSRGIEHHTLTLDAHLPATGIQQAARKARYDILTRFCREHHILHLLLAHHRDDQAETVLIRQSRGSGPDGLAGMSPLREYNGVRLLRPLLGISKSRLLEYLRTQQQAWIEDPTNTKDIYTRNKIRKSLSEAPEKSEQAITESVSYARERAVRERDTAKILVRYVTLNAMGIATLSRTLFAEVDDTMQARIVSAITQTVGGHDTPPRSGHTARLLASLPQTPAGKKRSFGGCWWIARTQDIVIAREPNAVEPQRDITAGETVFWDRRFTLTAKTSHRTCRLGALGTEGMKQLLAARPGHLLPPFPKAAFYALPSLRGLEGGILLPHIDSKSGVHVAFSPAKTLAGPHFYCNN